MTAPLSVLALAAALGSGGSDETPRFAEPVQLSAGEAVAGIGRLYASPGFHDVDADGRLDLVVGDLIGNVTWAPRLEGAGYGPEQPMKGRDGKDLKFNNW